MIEGRMSLSDPPTRRVERGVGADQTEHADADQADLDALAEGDGAHHRGVQRQERADPDEQRRFVVGTELVDREVLHGDRNVVDHTIADVEDRALPTAAQTSHEFRGAECDDGRGQTGQCTERGR